MGFIAATLLIYYAVPIKFRNAILSMASISLLAWVDPWFAVIFCFVAVLNYFGAIWIDANDLLKNRHRALLLIITANVLLLISLKYSNTYHRLAEILARGLSFDNPIPTLHWLLPLGFSYYMFQAIGYQIEVYRKSQLPEKNFINFSVYLGFFGKIFAGPIERSTSFLPALRNHLTLEYQHFSHGFRLILWGVFKFIVISNWIGSLIAPAYDPGSEITGTPMLFAMMLYTVQVYAEFSGYTDIALGTGRLFGFRLTQNFRQPFLAKSLSDFWRRWHISLSSWVMDYIYTPLSLWISLRISPGKGSVMAALFISFLILGLWHGTSWNFVIFGLIQGTFLALEILTQNTRKKHLHSGLGKFSGHVATICIFVISAQFFKTTNFNQAFQWIGNSLTFSATDFASLLQFDGVAFFYLSIIVLYILFDHIVIQNGVEIWLEKRPLVLRWLFYAILIYAIVAGTESSVQPLIYQGF